MSFEQSYAEFAATEESVIHSYLEWCFEPTLVLYQDSWQVASSAEVPTSLWFSASVRLSSLLEQKNHIPCAHWRSDTCDCTEDCQLPR
jgi:hypothetical protein